MLLTIAIIISSVSFLYYGVTFYTSAGMKDEFERYGLSNFRIFIGGLQLLGGIGLLIGFMWQPALIISSGGLALLMLIGFGVRVKLKDGFLLSLPSFAFMLLNLYIFIQSV